MKRLRLWLAVLIVWLFFFYNIERLSEPINIATFVYIFVLVSALLVLLVKPLLRLKLYWFYLMTMPIYLVIKFGLGHHVFGTKLPITVTEMAAIGLTILLTGQVVHQLSLIDDAIYNMITDPNQRETFPFEAGQSQIYREVRRARKRQRPLSLLAVTISDHTFKSNMQRFLQQIEQETVRRYVNGKLGNMLLEKLHSTDLVLQRNNHFVVVLSETEKADAYKVVDRLQNMATKDLGMQLKIGVATFPEEATTFETLLQNVETQIGAPATDDVTLEMPDSDDMRMQGAVNP